MPRRWKSSTPSRRRAYAGATTISGGILSTSSLANGGQASGIGASTNAAVNVALSGGILLYTGGSLSIDRGFTVSGAGGIGVSNSGTVLEITGTIGSGLTKSGAGTLVLSG